jgi:hypothetical protein
MHTEVVKILTKLANPQKLFLRYYYSGIQLTQLLLELIWNIYFLLTRTQLIISRLV